MSSKNSSLGRGMDSLLPQNFDQSFLLDESERIKKVNIDKVHPNKDQPRKQFDQDSINQLSSSIKRHGILQPLIVSPNSTDDSYIIVAGERRWRAAKLAGLKVIPVIIRSAEELEQLEIALVENVQRVDLSALEQAASIERLHDQFNMAYKEIAERLGKAETTIINIVRLLNLPKDANASLRNGEITEGHARAILALKDKPEKQTELLSNIKRLGWSVRQAETFVVGTKKENKAKEDIKIHMQKETKETKLLAKALSTPVSIRRTASGGKLEIEFKSDQNLSEIMKRLLK